jgi:hypothetical protein
MSWNIEKRNSVWPDETSEMRFAANAVKRKEEATYYGVKEQRMW